MSAKDLGPLDYRIAIVDAQGRPSPEFQRRWNTQRTNNTQIPTPIIFGTGAPTSVPTEDGDEYVDTSTTPYTLYVSLSGTWHQVAGSGGGGGGGGTDAFADACFTKFAGGI